MSIYTQTKVKKQQKRKRAKAVIRARNQVIKFLSSRKFKQAETAAKTLLKKYPDDVRAWRLVAGVEAWRGFEAKLKGLSDSKKKAVKAQALRVWEKEVKARNNMTKEGLLEVLTSLIPQEQETKTKKTETKKAETDQAPAEDQESEPDKPAKKTRKTSKKTKAEKTEEPEASQDKTESE